MKKTLLYMLLVLGSCSPDKKSSDTEAAESQPAEPCTTAGSISSGCYRMNIERDSAFMNLIINDNVVTGQLDYKPYEKDQSSGNFSGVIDKDKVIGWYTFQSEGMISVRQMIYKISGSTLVEGYGDIDVSNDSAFFKYPDNLNYEMQHPFTLVPCE